MTKFEINLYEASFVLCGESLCLTAVLSRPESQLMMAIRWIGLELYHHTIESSLNSLNSYVLRIEITSTLRKWRQRWPFLDYPWKINDII